MNLIAHFSLKELAHAIKVISISMGLPERLELLYFLLDREIYREQVVEEALCHCVHFFIDHEQSPKLKEGLVRVCRVLKNSRIPTKTLKIIAILEKYVEWARTNPITNNIYRISEGGVEFYEPICF